MSDAAENRSLGLFRVLCTLAAIWGIGAGVIHFLAVGDHREHLLIAAFFAVTAVAQIAWAVLLILRPSKVLLYAGIAGNLALIGVWAISRTSGLPFVPGAEQAEPVGVRDIITVLFEALAAGTSALGAALTSAAVLVPSGQRLIAASSAIALLLVTPATFANGAHGHGGAAHDDVHAAGEAHPHNAADGDTHKHGEGAGHDQHGKGNAHQHGDGTHEGHADDGAVQAGNAHEGHGGPGHEGHHGTDGTQGHGDGHEGHEGTGGHGDHGTGGHGDHGTGGHHAEEGFSEPAMWGTKTRMRVGPFYLPPKDLGGDVHVNRVGFVPEKPCDNCYITGIKPDLVYADGSPADVDTGPMMHHVVISDTGREDPTCNRFQGVGLAGLRIFASGNERTSFALPRGYGYKGTDAPWSYIAELMNSSDKGRTVYVEADVFHVPASTKGMKPIRPVWMDVANCGFSEYSVPAGKSTERWSWPSSVTGRVVAAGGHVHSGGVGIILRNGSTGKRMCTSEARYGTTGAFKGEVVDMSTCIWDKLGTVREGQRLEIDSIYDTPKPLDGVMGILMLAVHETDDLSGGTTAPSWMRRNPDTKPTESGHDH